MAYSFSIRISAVVTVVVYIIVIKVTLTLLVLQSSREHAGVHFRLFFGHEQCPVAQSDLQPHLISSSISSGAGFFKHSTGT